MNKKQQGCLFGFSGQTIKSTGIIGSLIFPDPVGGGEMYQVELLAYLAGKRRAHKEPVLHASFKTLFLQDFSLLPLPGFSFFLFFQFHKIRRLTNCTLRNSINRSTLSFKRLIFISNFDKSLEVISFFHFIWWK